MLLANQRFSALFVIIFCSLLYVSDCYAQSAAKVAASVNGSPTDVLAEIKDIKITRAMYDTEADIFKQVAAPQAAAQMVTPEGRQDFLRQLVEVTMFQKKAELEGIHKTDSYKNDLRKSTESVLSIERFRKMIDSITVDEAEAKKFYKENIKGFTEPDQYHLFRISTDSKEKADAIVKDLKSGKSFVEIAKTSSIDESKANGGDRGFVVLDNEMPEIAAAVSSLEKDKVSAPLNIAEGLFVIVKYTEKKTGTVKAFETVSAQIRRDLANQKQVEVFKGEIARLKKAYKFSLDEKAVELLRKESLTEAERNVVLAKYEGGEVKVAEVYKEFEQIPAFIRPQILGGEGLKDFLDQHFARVLSIADTRKNFAAYSKENPRVVADVERRTMVKGLFDKVLSPVALSDEEIKDYYSKNLAKYEAPAHIHAHHILVQDEKNAKSLLETLQKDPSKFEEVAKASSICPSGKQGGDLGSFGEGQMVPEFEAACKTAEIGKVIGPVKTQFGYHIIRVDGRTEARVMALDEVKDEIKRELLPQKQKKVFDEYVESLRKEFNVKVYQENL